jgi:hypothetical protein
MRYDLHMLDIAVLDDRDPLYNSLEIQLKEAKSVVVGSAGHVALCTTFSPYDFEQPGFAERAIRQLNEKFADGAIAVKIYKTIGWRSERRMAAT